MKWTIQTIMVGFSLIMMGCSYTLAPNVTIKPVYQYKFVQEQEGLRIAVDPYFENERLKDSFDADLLSYGILPVLIVVENYHPKSVFLLNKEGSCIAKTIEYQPEAKADVDHPAVSISKGLKKGATYSAVVIGVGGIIGSPIMIEVAMPVLFYGAKKELDLKRINENIFRKALLDKTIHPGETHSGFIYFKIKDREAIQDIGVVLIKAKSISKDKDLDIIFQINK